MSHEEAIRHAHEAPTPWVPAGVSRITEAWLGLSDLVRTGHGVWENSLLVREQLLLPFPSKLCVTPSRRGLLS